MEIGFDIIVPTFNRYKELPLFFKKNEALNKSIFKVWIVDDFSDDYNPQIIPSWDNLIFLRQESNKGQAFARNVAIRKGTYPYVISLDDDAWFEDAELAVNELNRLFDTYPDAGCVMFNIATPDSSYSTLSTGTTLPLHVTCGCAYRREVLEQINGFSEFLHSQAEETDISLRIYQANWSIIFSNEIRVFHNFSPGLRTLQWYYNARHNTTRNDLLVVVMYFPLLLVGPFLIGKYIGHLRYAIITRQAVFITVGYTVKALISFAKLLPEALKKRKPLTINQFNCWRDLFKEKILLHKKLS